MTLKGAPVATLDYGNGAPTAIESRRLTHFGASRTKNTVPTRLAAGPSPNVVSVARHITLRCAVRHMRKDKGKQQPEVPAVPRGIVPGAWLALSGRRGPRETGSR